MRTSVLENHRLRYNSCIPHNWRKHIAVSLHKRNTDRCVLRPSQLLIHKLNLGFIDLHNNGACNAQQIMIQHPNETLHSSTWIPGFPTPIIWATIKLKSMYSVARTMWRFPFALLGITYYTRHGRGASSPWNLPLRRMFKLVSPKLGSMLPTSYLQHGIFYQLRFYLGISSVILKLNMVYGEELVFFHRIPSILATLQCMVGSSVEVWTKIIL